METVYPITSADSSWLIDQGQSKLAWSKEENKRFESALAMYDEKTPNRWYKVAEMIPGKSVCDVINQYRELVADVSDIEAGLVPIPGYLASSFTFELADHRGFDVYRKRGRNCTDQERKKGVPWTEDEHRRFLLGLQKHGKGDWRSISRNFVVTKTPTQVASHAQKYYLRQVSGGGKDKRRPSIHDITTVNPAAVDQPNQLPTPTISSKIVMEWNNHKIVNNDATSNLMVFDGDSFVAYPGGADIAKHGGGHYIFNIGADYSPGSRFYG
ncbi:hypothetical protein ACS0TY_000958 [Phlomoides rotata]